MATASCDCCGILGCHIMKQHKAPIAGPLLAQRRIVTYNMGHGQTTTDENVAKNILLEREFKEIVQKFSMCAG